MTCLLLHSSGYSSVLLGASSDNEACLSCYKVYNKDYPLQPRHWLNISRECCILSRLQEERVDGIVQLLGVTDTARHFSLQFEPCLGGNLWQCLERRECCDEQQLCTKVIIPLLQVLDNLHRKGIIHRDIKPENVFFEADGKLVLGDFGLAIDSRQDRPCSRVGTQDYMAPEVLAQPSADTVALCNIPSSSLTSYTTAVDIWALGTLIHEALSGKVPFYHAEPSVMALKAQFGRSNRLPASTSPECQAFVDAVLQKQPSKRPTAVELLQHPWVLRHHAAAAALVAARLKARVLAELQLERLSLSSTASSPRGCPKEAVALIAAAEHPASNCSSSDRAKHAAATRLLEGCIPAAAVTSSSSMCSSTAGCPAPSLAATSTNDSISSKATAVSISCSSSSSANNQGATGGGKLVMSGLLRCGAATEAAAKPAGRKAGCNTLQQSRNAWCCKPRKVSFDFTTAQLQRHESACETAGAVEADAAAGTNRRRALWPKRHIETERSSSASCVPMCREAAAAIAGGCGVEDGNHQLGLLPALSEPMLIDVTSHLHERESDDGAGCKSSSAQCCCCSCPSGRRTSQSGTCSAAVAEATAGKQQPYSWQVTNTAVVAANNSKRPAVSQHDGADSCQHCSSKDAPAAEGALSAPGHTGALQKALSAGHEPHSLSHTLDTPASMRRVVQLGGACGSMAALPPAEVGAATNGACAASNSQYLQQKLPVLLPCDGPLGMGLAAGTGSTAVGVKLLSPPKPAALMQRLRSFGRERAALHSSRASDRRHSVDIAGGFPGLVAPKSGGGTGKLQPSAAGTPLGMGAISSPSAPPSPQKHWVRPAAAGFASPLSAALGKLGGFLSPASSVSTAAGSSNIMSTAPCCSHDGPAGVAKRLNVRLPQRGPGVGEAGTAALLLGLAGPGLTTHTAGAGLATSLPTTVGAVSPTSGCKMAKGVCLKVLNQVLRHQQQA